MVTCKASNSDVVGKGWLLTSSSWFNLWNFAQTQLTQIRKEINFKFIIEITYNTISEVNCCLWDQTRSKFHLTLTLIFKNIITCVVQPSISFFVVLFVKIKIVFIQKPIPKSFISIAVFLCWVRGCYMRYQSAGITYIENNTNNMPYTQ